MLFPSAETLQITITSKKVEYSKITTCASLSNRLHKIITRIIIIVWLGHGF